MERKMDYKQTGQSSRKKNITGNPAASSPHHGMELQMVKFLVKLLTTVAVVIVVVVTVIKFVQGCSYREAVGILEEFFKEMRESCRRCCMKKDESADDDTMGVA